jgi:hypothetical protein
MSSDPAPLGQSHDLPWWRGPRASLALGWIGTFAALVVLVGALCGLFWVQVVDLPSYTVRDDFSARTTERGLTEYFATDAWFVAIGLTVSLGIGLVAWKWFSELGWPVAVLAGAGSLLAGLVCWQTGQWLGPGPFEARLGAANPGDVVPIQFQLRSLAALSAWVVGGVLPVLAWATLGPDSEDPPPPPRPQRWTRHQRRSAVGPAAESGEVVGHDIDPVPSRGTAG